MQDWLVIMADKDNVRLNITISRYDFRKLRNWAKIHGRAPTTYGGQIISSRLESNTDTINRQMQEIAAYEGISVEELERRWDNDKSDE